MARKEVVCGVICQCGTCRETFQFSELVKKQRVLYGATITEKHCPFCDAIGFTPLKAYDKVTKVNDEKRDLYQKVVEGWWT